ncbi:hypothetical protein [Methylobacterium gossipiicola]|uniref:Uncharacterized protein n=1 Tax=Methylobacterium gossipiicola TaxID=582675 RepID=A0A1I2TV34_9HYPH|nr:hypothetical protein [Methylobacterium gossipiicola]SFG66161.1 hypothetical protein SAMN05192565_107221 [Methylobacterium gossipiicola]
MKRRVTNPDVREVFAALCARFGLQPYQPRPGAAYVWGEEKLRARCNRLMRQLTVIEAEQEAATQAFARRMHELGQRRAACLLELTMADLYAAAAERSGKPDAAAPAPDSNAQAVSPLGTTVAPSSDPGSGETPTLPDHEADPGSGEPAPASRTNNGAGAEDVHGDGVSMAQRPADRDPGPGPDGDPIEYDVDPELAAMLPTIEACAPDWRDVSSPPQSVRERFPLFEKRIGPLRDIDREDLIELLVLLPAEHDDLVRAAPIFAAHLFEWFWSEDGAACRAALSQAIEREQARRAVWCNLLGWYRWVVALAPGGSWQAATREQVRAMFQEEQAEFVATLDPHRLSVWLELTALLAGGA